MAERQDGEFGFEFEFEFSLSFLIDLCDMKLHDVKTRFNVR